MCMLGKDKNFIDRWYKRIGKGGEYYHLLYSTYFYTDSIIGRNCRNCRYSMGNEFCCSLGVGELRIC